MITVYNHNLSSLSWEIGGDGQRSRNMGNLISKSPSCGEEYPLL
jgi:hypothetical protein